METLITKIQKENIPKTNLREKKFSAKSLSMTGEIEVRVPGRKAYTGVTAFDAYYEKPMDVYLNGSLTEIQEGIRIDEGRVQLTAERENKTEERLGHTEKDLVLRVTDPELTLYQNDKKTVLNQVIGMPVIYVKSGFLTYNK